MESVIVLSLRALRSRPRQRRNRALPACVLVNHAYHLTSRGHSRLASAASAAESAPLPRSSERCSRRISVGGKACSPAAGTRSHALAPASSGCSWGSNRRRASCPASASERRRRWRCPRHRVGAGGSPRPTGSLAGRRSGRPPVKRRRRCRPRVRLAVGAGDDERAVGEPRFPTSATAPLRRRRASPVSGLPPSVNQPMRRRVARRRQLGARRAEPSAFATPALRGAAARAAAQPPPRTQSDPEGARPRTARRAATRRAPIRRAYHPAPTTPRAAGGLVADARHRRLARRSPSTARGRARLAGGGERRAVRDERKAAERRRGAGEVAVPPSELSACRT